MSGQSIHIDVSVLGSPKVGKTTLIKVLTDDKEYLVQDDCITQ